MNRYRRAWRGLVAVSAAVSTAFWPGGLGWAAAAPDVILQVVGTQQAGRMVDIEALGVPDSTWEFQFWVCDRSGGGTWQLLQPYRSNNSVRLRVPVGSALVLVDALPEAAVKAGDWGRAQSAQTVLSGDSAVQVMAPATATAQNTVTLSASSSGLLYPVYWWRWQGPSGKWHQSAGLWAYPQWEWTPDQP
ncbi:MAG: hypothetical protein OWS74_06325, partial [Firmicutes bacterium]|nr:hypothetical protein [Bacillota bacterium]